MNNIFNKEIQQWERPWNVVKFDDMTTHDTRFFSILIKGLLQYLTSHIVLYNKPINHYILQTGTEYLYVEQNGYEFSWNTTSGENTLYSHLPRCNVSIDDFRINKESLSQPYSYGQYERVVDDEVQTYAAQIRRLPLEIQVNLQYSLSNFNESIILIEELFNELVFQRYFKIAYLGQVIDCSIEFPESAKIEFNRPDMIGVESKNRLVNLTVTLRTNYPMIDNKNTETSVTNIIASFHHDANPHEHQPSGILKTTIDNDNTINIVD